MSEKEKDWELSDDYYSVEEKKCLSLEDFITEDQPKSSESKVADLSDEALKKTIEDVHQVLALAQEGKSIAEIKERTKLEESYIHDIQVCAQGFHEDDEIAVAYLMLG
ncbi:hypothetical protein [Clostridium sp. E02]|uniref:hypothetical protein n=1 Tax=Clostridium sp. E02 TaxID=2487134 RepID=UPI000F5375BC|nr:hypothetical protein [Clostridium sp. E02]